MMEAHRSLGDTSRLPPHPTASNIVV